MHHPGRPTFGVQVFGYYEFRLFPNYPINQKKKKLPLTLGGLQICR